MIKHMYAIDIETYTQGKRADDYTDNLQVKLGNLKDPEKIKVKLKEAKEKAKKQHALNWWTGKIISVAMVSVENPHSDRWFCASHDEQEILLKLTEKLRGGTMQLIGKSAKTFDYGFLKGRYMANNIPIPGVLKVPSRLHDMDDFFGYGSMNQQRSSLNNYAFGLKMKPKLMSGGSVHAIYTSIIAKELAGDDTDHLWRQLIEYNLDDADKVAVAAQRYYA